MALNEENFEMILRETRNEYKSKDLEPRIQIE